MGDYADLWQQGAWNIIWVLAFACSVIPNGVTAVLQERLFHEQPKLDIVLILFWSNVFSVIGQVFAFHLLHTLSMISDTLLRARSR